VQLKDTFCDIKTDRDQIHLRAPDVRSRYCARSKAAGVHTISLGLQREAAGPDGIRWSMPDQYAGLLKSLVQIRLDRPRSDL
jgi:hypothetical protein